MLIEEFLDRVQQGQWPRNLYLEEPEWHTLYVRYGPVGAMDQDGFPVVVKTALHLANFEAKKPRTGAFTRLVNRINRAAPGLPCFVENLFDLGFACRLPGLGFERVWTSTELDEAQCFLKGAIGQIPVFGTLDAYDNRKVGK